MKYSLKKDIVFEKLSKSLFLKFIESILILLIYSLISRYLGPANLGQFTYILSLVLIIEPFGRIGMRQILIDTLAKNKKNPSIVKTTLLIELFFYTLLIFFTLPIFIKILSFKDLVIYLILSFAYLIRAGENLLNIFYVYKSPGIVGLIQVSSNIIFLILIAFSALLNFDIFYLSIIFFINFLIKELIIFFAVIKKRFLFLIKKIDKKKLKEFIFQGLLVSLSGFIGILLFKVDIIFINNYLGDYQTGLYAAPMKILTNFTVLFTVISNNLVPYLPVNIISSKNNNLIRLYRYTWLFALISSIGFYIFGSKFIMVYLGESYALSKVLIPYLTFSIFFQGIAVADNAYLNFYNFRGVIIVKSIISLLINIVFNILLIPIIGIRGAAFALTLATFFNGFGGFLIKPNLNKHYLHLLLPIHKYLKK